MNQVHILQNLFKIRFNIIVPYTPLSPKWFHPVRFYAKSLRIFLTRRVCVTCSSRLKPLDLIAVMIFGETYK